MNHVNIHRPQAILDVNNMVAVAAFERNKQYYFGKVSEMMLLLYSTVGCCGHSLTYVCVRARRRACACACSAMALIPHDDT